MTGSVHRGATCRRENQPICEAAERLTHIWRSTDRVVGVPIHPQDESEASPL